jgi:hypothetical protein
MVRPGLVTEPRTKETLALAGRQQIHLELDGEHTGIFRHQRKGGVAAGRIQRGGNDASMKEAVLLGQRLEKGSSISTVPRRDEMSVLRLWSTMAACRAKDASHPLVKI